MDKTTTFSVEVKIVLFKDNYVLCYEVMIYWQFCIYYYLIEWQSMLFMEISDIIFQYLRDKFWTGNRTLNL